jgi:hypothetical protein
MTDAKARLLKMIADEPHMGGGGLLKAIGKAQKVAKAAKTADEVVLEKVLHKPFVVVVKDTLVLLDSLIFEDIKKELIAVF